MSLMGFKSNNHPQQVAKRGARDSVDERLTPDWLFERYDAVHGFTLDVAANARNAKKPAFYDLESDGLKQPWAPHRVWCNPPFSNLGAWVKKAHEELDRGCPVIVMLLPANRTEQGWWQEWVEPFRDRSGAVIKVEFLRSRINFGAPGNEGAKYKSSAPFGCVMLTFARSAQEAA